jgi:chaperonin GroES
MMLLRPLRDLVLVKRLDIEEKIGSIIIPENARVKAQRGEVIAVGRGERTKRGLILKPGVNVGNVIWFGRYAGEDIKSPFGEDHLMLKEDEILGVDEGACKPSK